VTRAEATATGICLNRGLAQISTGRLIRVGSQASVSVAGRFCGSGAHRPWIQIQNQRKTEPRPLGRRVPDSRDHCSSCQCPR
jgi:hypothetical protein